MAEANTMAGKAHQLRSARAMSRRYVSGVLVNCQCTECKAGHLAANPRTFAERMARAKREMLARHKARGLTEVE